MSAWSTGNFAARLKEEKAKPAAAPKVDAPKKAEEKPAPAPVPAPVPAAAPVAAPAPVAPAPVQETPAKVEPAAMGPVSLPGSLASLVSKGEFTFIGAVKPPAPAPAAAPVPAPAPAVAPAPAPVPAASTRPVAQPQAPVPLTVTGAHYERPQQRHPEPVQSRNPGYYMSQQQEQPNQYGGSYRGADRPYHSAPQQYHLQQYQNAPAYHPTMQYAGYPPQPYNNNYNNMGYGNPNYGGGYPAQMGWMDYSHNRLQPRPPYYPPQNAQQQPSQYM